MAKKYKTKNVVIAFASLFFSIVCSLLIGGVSFFAVKNYNNSTNNLTNQTQVLSINNKFNGEQFVVSGGQVYKYSNNTTHASTNLLNINQTSNFQLIFLQDGQTMLADVATQNCIASILTINKNNDINITLEYPHGTAYATTSPDAEYILGSLAVNASSCVSFSNGEFLIGEQKGATSLLSTSSYVDAVILHQKAGSFKLTGNVTYTPKTPNCRAFLQTGGTLTLDGPTFTGFEYTNEYRDYWGGSVLYIQNGTFNFDGGVIGSTATTLASEEDYSNGGYSIIFASPLDDDYVEVNLNGGTMGHNYTTGNTYSFNGRGEGADNMYLNMLGTTIQYNSTGGDSIVYIDSGCHALLDGSTISNNQSTYNLFWDECGFSTFTMQSGHISNNSCDLSVLSCRIVNTTGGEISNNTCDSLLFIYMSNNGVVGSPCILSGLEITGNTCSTIVHVESDGPDIQISDMTISGNTFSDNIISSTNNRGMLWVENCNFINNISTGKPWDTSYTISTACSANIIDSVIMGTIYSDSNAHNDLQTTWGSDIEILIKNSTFTAPIRAQASSITLTNSTIDKIFDPGSGATFIINENVNFTTTTGYAMSVYGHVILNYEPTFAPTSAEYNISLGSDEYITLNVELTSEILVNKDGLTIFEDGDNSLSYLAYSLNANYLEAGKQYLTVVNKTPGYDFSTEEKENYLVYVRPIYSLTYSVGKNGILGGDGVEYLEYTADTDLELNDAYREFTNFTGWKVYIEKDEDGNPTTQTSWAEGSIIPADELDIGSGHYGNVTLSMQYEWFEYQIIIDSQGHDDALNETMPELSQPVYVRYNGSLKTAYYADGTLVYGQEGSFSLPDGMIGFARKAEERNSKNMIKISTQFNESAKFEFDHDAGTVTIYAAFKTVTIVFFDNSGNTVGGSQSTNRVVDIGLTIVLPESNRSYHTFKGWYSAYTGGTKYGDGGDEFFVGAPFIDLETTVYYMYAQYDTVAGLYQVSGYQDDGEGGTETIYALVYSWQELLDNDMISVEDGVLYGEDSSMQGILVIDNSITTIGDNAFEGYENLTQVIFADGITHVGDYAFDCCYNLRKVYLGNTLQTIGDGGFADSGLTELELPDSMQSIGEASFAYCNLKSIDFGTGLHTIGTRAFEECCNLAGELKIPDNVETIYSEAFWCCCSVTSLKIGRNVSYIGEKAFGADSLKHIYVYEDNTTYHSQDDCLIETDTNILLLGSTSSIIPEYIVEIASHAFAYSRFSSLSLPEGLTIINEYAFANTNIQGELELPSTLIYIGERAFNSCNKLAGELILPDGLTYIGNEAFSSCKGIVGTLVIPDSVITLGGWAFNYCEGLESVEFGTGISQLSEYAFRYCTGLTEIYLPANITSIGNSAFYGCTNLTSVVAAGDITSIGDWAFYGNRNTLSYDFTSCTSVPTLGTNVFSSINRNCKIYVPEPHYDAWITATNWSHWEDYIIYAPGLYNNATGAIIYSWQELLNFGKITITNGIILGSDPTMAGKLVMADTITAIGTSAFSGYTGLVGNLRLPNSIISIAAYAFNGCTGLTGKLDLPDNLSALGDSAFQNCSGFTGELQIPDKLSVIAAGAFKNCSGLTSVEARDVSQMGNEVFNGCSNVLSYNFAYVQGVPTLGTSAFTGINNNCKIYVPEPLYSQYISATNWVDWKDYIYYMYGLYDKTTGALKYTWQQLIDRNYIRVTNGELVGNGSSNISGRLVISDTITSIGNNAFKNYTNLVGMVLPNSITNIGNYAFFGCSNLTGQLILPENLSYLGSYAFNGCTKLTGELTIPQNVTVLKEYVFYNCEGLTGVTVLGDITEIQHRAFYSAQNILYYDFTSCTSVPVLNNTQAFSEINNDCLIYVPSTLYNSWQNAANWSNYKDYITILPGLYNENYEVVYTWQQLIDQGKITVTNGTLMGNDNTLAGKLVISNDVTTIGDSSFNGYNGLTSLIVSNSVIRIEIMHLGLVIL